MTQPSYSCCDLNNAEKIVMPNNCDIDAGSK